MDICFSNVALNIHFAVLSFYLIMSNASIRLQMILTFSGIVFPNLFSHKVLIPTDCAPFTSLLIESPM